MTRVQWTVDDAMIFVLFYFVQILLFFRFTGLEQKYRRLRDEETKRSQDRQGNPFDRSMPCSSTDFKASVRIAAPPESRASQEQRRTRCRQLVATHNMPREDFRRVAHYHVGVTWTIKRIQFVANIYSNTIFNTPWANCSRAITFLFMRSIDPSIDRCWCLACWPNMPSVF